MTARENKSVISFTIVETAYLLCYIRFWLPAILSTKDTYIYKETGLVNGFKKHNKNPNSMKFYARESLCLHETVNTSSVVKLLYGIYYS